MTALVFDLIGRDAVSRPANTAASSMNRLAAASDRAAASATKVQASMATAGRSLTRTVTLPLLAIAGASVKAATDFQSSMTRIQTQAGGTAKDVQVLSKQVLDLAKTAQQGPNELAQALYHLKSVGLDNVAAMKALKQASDLAAVGGADLEDTTNALAGAWRTGIQGAKNFHTAVATVNAIIGAGNMTMADFNEAIGTGILPSAKTFGLTLKDVGAALALFTDEGVPANAAATRLRMSFSLLAAPTGKAQEQLKSIGIGQYQLGNDLRKPNGLIAAISDLKQHLDASGLSATKQAALLSRAFGGGRSSSAILSMVNNLDVLQKKQEQVTNSLGKFDSAVKAQQQTPAAKFHVLIANLETVGVQLGNEIIPAVLKLTHLLSGAVQWFDHLNTSTHGFLVTAGGIALLAGPVLSLTAKIMGAFRAVGLFAQGAQRATLATEEMTSSSYLAGRSFAGNFGPAMTRAAGAVGKFTAAIGGAAVGAAIGSMTQHASSATKAIGVLGSTAAGAALGFSAGGPWGAAIGAGAGLLSSLATSFGGVSQAAQDAAAAEQTYTDSVKKSLDAMSKANTQQAISNLTTSQAYTALDLLHKQGALTGTTYLDLTNAVTGSNKQFQSLISTLHSSDPIMGAIFGQLKNTLIAQRNGLHGAIAAQKDYKKASDQAGIGALKLTDRAKEQAGWFNKDGTYAKVLADKTNDVATSMHSAWLAGKQLAQALQDLGGKQLNTAQAEISMQQGLENLRQSWKKNGDAILGNTSAQVNNRSLILDQIENVKAYAETLDHGKDAAKNVSTALRDGIAAIKANAVALGGNKSAVMALIRQMHLTPKDIYTKFHTDTADAKHAAIELQRFLQNLVNTNWTVHVGATGAGISYTGRNPAGGVNGGHIATGGYVRGPGTGTSDSIPAWISNGEFVVNAKQTARHLSLLHAINRGVAGYAKGGQITTTTVGGDKKWVFHGTKYASLTAAENAEHTWAKKHQSNLRSRVSGVLGGIGQTGGPPFTLGAGFGIGKLMSQLAHAWHVLQHQIDAGLSKGAATRFEHQIKHFAHLAQKQLNDLRVHIRKHDMDAISKALKGTAADLRGAFSSLIADVKAAGGQSGLIDRLTAKEKNLLAVQKQRAATLAHLKQVQSNYDNALSSAKSAASTFFDPSQAGANAAGNVNAGSFRAQQLQAATRIKAFFNGIKKLESYHLNPAYLASIAQQGPGALPQVQALLQMGRSGTKSVNATEREINRYARRIGRTAAHYQYGDELHELRREARHERHREEQIEHRMEHAIKEALSGWEIKIDSRGQARLVHTGNKKNNR